MMYRLQRKRLEATLSHFLKMLSLNLKVSLLFRSPNKDSSAVNFEDELASIHEENANVVRV